MKIWHICAAAMLTLASCQFGSEKVEKKPDIFTDTVVYTYKNIHQRAADCGNKADSACTVATISYPEFTGQPALNDTIQHRLALVFASPDVKFTNLQGMVQNYFAEYADFKKGYGKGKEMFYELQSSAKVVDQDSALISIEYDAYTYRGGAHGGSFTGFINWNPKTQKQITLNDILKPGYKDSLNKTAERIFRKDEKLTDTSSLARDYFFDKAKFALNNNYLITPLGIRFMYNQYEIKPYAAGQTELFIPYTDIRMLVKPDGIVGHFINKNAGI